jgi:hypothetical protein
MNEKEAEEHPAGRGREEPDGLLPPRYLNFFLVFN